MYTCTVTLISTVPMSLKDNIPKEVNGELRKNGRKRQWGYEN